jgi:hypothetical protein
LWFAGTFGVALGTWNGADDDDRPLPVRFPEGALHGFLLLRDSAGREIAAGDLLVAPRDGAVESRMVFRFHDGSRLDERVRFTQDSVFRMLDYRLAQRGPAFPGDLDVALDGISGRYRVTSHPREGDAEIHQDTLEIPADTYNGMVLTISKNLPPDSAGRVHFVAFTPKPRMIELEVGPAGTDTIAFGRTRRPVERYVVKPRLGALRQFVATVLGKDPSDNLIWLVTEDVPGFVAFEGPLYPSGPWWRIELAAPEAGVARTR